MFGTCALPHDVFGTCPFLAQATAPEPKAMPRPVQTVMPLCIPLARRDAQEEALVRRALHLQHMQWCQEVGVPLWVHDCPEATDPSMQSELAIAAEETELDKVILRIMGVSVAALSAASLACATLGRGREGHAQRFEASRQWGVCVCLGAPCLTGLALAGLVQGGEGRPCNGCGSQACA
jgi:hypothetical protein